MTLKEQKKRKFHGTHYESFRSVSKKISSFDKNKVIKDYIEEQLDDLSKLKDNWYSDEKYIGGRSFHNDEIAWLKNNVIVYFWDWENLPKTYLSPNTDGSINIFWKTGFEGERRTTFKANIVKHLWAFDFFDLENIDKCYEKEGPFNDNSFLLLLKKYLIDYDRK